jgi:hypothetical protein
MVKWRMPPPSPIIGEVMSPSIDPDLVLGPILRRVAGGRATVWVQTARPATVEIRAGSAGGAARTFTAYGCHYALVVVEGLEPGTDTPYTVLLGGREVWPPPDYPFPPSVIRTRADGQPTRLVFGSCRQAPSPATGRFLPDALDAYAARLASTPAAPWPDLLVLLGDQVYADDTSPGIRRWLRTRRQRRRPDAPVDQVVSFPEYTRLYLESWTEPEIRWLMSTVPSVMIFDDHEIIDDWNTSASWRDDMQAFSWWRQRISAGFASYWVYQHLGNLDPDTLGADPVYAAVCAAGDASAVLSDFGERADAERHGYRWSYALDIGRTRLVVLDTRAGRHLEPEKRAILPDEQWRWFVDAVAGDGYDHLVLGSSLPWLLAPAMHDVEAVNERLADSPRRRVARAAERFRRALDLEHWAAFGRSFEAMAAVLGQLVAGSPAPATISVISGDVHHSYIARARLGPVYQLVCSPVHNQLPRALRPVVRTGWTRGAAVFTRALARLAGTPPPSVRWDLLAGPFVDNAVGTLVQTGRSAHATIEGTDAEGRLRPLAKLELSETA